MARTNRSKHIDPSRVQVLHVYNRCARQEHLFGRDPDTGKDRSHRRTWIRERLQHLSEIFSIDVLTYAVLSSHVHQVIRSRPDLAETLDAEAIARKWLAITPKLDKRTGQPKEPTEKEIRRIVDDPKRVEKLRRRLSDVSWWMRYFSQYISVRVNREEGARGHLWEGRFKDDLLLDVASILRCMLYVDLNLVRAGLASSIQESDFTGAKDRLDDLRIAVATQKDGSLHLLLEPGGDAFYWERLDHPCSGWLSPIELDGMAIGLPPSYTVQVAQNGGLSQNAGFSREASSLRVAQQADFGQTHGDNLTNREFSADSSTSTSKHQSSVAIGVFFVTELPQSSTPLVPRTGHPTDSNAHFGTMEQAAKAMIEKSRRRASNKGALPISLPKYLTILDLVGRRPRPGGSAVIDSQIELLVSELNIGAEALFESICVFGKRYELPMRPSMEMQRNRRTGVAIAGVTSDESMVK